jgi:kynurenine 3-monooxygenase
MSLFEREYKEVIPLMPTLEEDFFRNPSSTLTQVQGGPWHYEDKVLLIGDACHAVTPFYGMGMNIGFEDCIIFMNILKEKNYNFKESFIAFSRTRKPDTDAMTDLSYKNFKSIGESPDPAYHLKWLLERKIWKLLPKLWTPTYLLVAFSETPLSEVAKIKKRQDRILDEIIEARPEILRVPDKQLKNIAETKLKNI